MGDLKQNYTKIWNPIMEAMAKANLTSAQHKLCWALWRMTYSWHRTEIEASYQDFARETGINPKKIGPPLRSLIQANVFIEVRKPGFTEPGIYKFNKDIRKWASSILDISMISETSLALVAEECDQEGTSLEVGDSPQSGTSPQNGTCHQDGTCPQNGDTPQKGTSPQNQEETSPQNGGEVPGLEPRNDAGFRTPKENIKESTCTCTPPPPSPKNGEGAGRDIPKQPTLDEILRRYPRYSEEEAAIIRDYWEMLRFTRKTGRIAGNVIAREMEYWERFPPDTVIEALRIHLRRCQTKREEYTRGIIRRLAEEREREGSRSANGGFTVQRSPRAPDTVGDHENLYAEYDRVWKNA